MSKLSHLNKLILPLLLLLFNIGQEIRAQVVPVISTNQAVVGDSLKGCQNVPYRFESQSTGPIDTTFWTFSGGTPASAGGPGPHNVGFATDGWAAMTIIDTNGVAWYDTIYVGVSTDIPLAVTFNGTNVVTFEGVVYQVRCGGGPGNVMIINSTSGYVAGTSYVVDFGDGSAPHVPVPSGTGAWNNVHAYPPGQHQLTVTATYGHCVKTITQPIYIGNQPNVGFAISSGTTLCVPDTISFPISSTAGNSPGTRYVVMVNDSTPADTFYHPPPAVYSHYFDFSSCGSTAIAGGQSFQNSYQAVITASNPCGQATVSLQPIYVSSKNRTGFDVTPDSLICIDAPVTLTDTTLYGMDVNSNSCNSSQVRVWEVSPPTNWTLLSGDMGDHFGFIDGGTFGYDPTFWFSGTQNIQLSFQQPGTYTLKLRTGNNCGQDSAETTICIDPPVTADFSLSDSVGCFPFVVSTTNLSTPGGGCGTDKYLWTVAFSDTVGCGVDDWQFINGTDSISFEPVFQFNQPGIYDIQLFTNPRLEPEDASRCPVDTMIRRVIVKGLPEATVTFPSPVCLPDTVNFTELVINCYGQDTLQFLWTLTGALPTMSTDTNPGPVLYQSHGLFPIELLVTNECGSDTVLDTIDVREPVIVNVMPGTSLCMDDTISVTGSVIGGSTTGSWSASVPGGTFSPDSLTIPAVYTPPAGYIGAVDIILISTDPPGPCPPDTAIIPLVYDQQAEAIPGVYPDICENGTQVLNGAIGGAGSSGVWSAQPAGTFTPDPSQLNASYTPPAGYSGTVNLTLITNDPPGSCLPDTATVTFIVNPTPTVDAVVTPTICSGDTTNIQLTSPFPGVVFEWIPVPNPNISGATADSGLVIQQELVNIGPADDVQVYDVTPYLNGCPGPVVQVSVNVRVNVQMVPTPDDTLCPGENAGPIVFTSVPPGATFTWAANNANLGLGSGSGDINAFVTPMNPGFTALTSDIEVIPTLNGCPGVPDTFTIVLNPVPDVTNAVLLDSVCSNSPSSQIVFTSNVNNTVFNWLMISDTGVSPGALISGVDSIPSQTLTTIGYSSGTVNYAVVPEAGGCKGDTAYYDLVVLPIPDVIVPADQLICPGDASLQVTLTSNTFGTIFNWTSVADPGISGNTASGTGDIPVEVLTNSSTSMGAVTYTITPVADGCAGTPQPYVISVEGSPDVIFSIPPQTICSNDTSQLVNLTSSAVGVTFNWSISVPASITYTGPMSGTGDIPAFILTNTSNVIDSVVVTAVATPPAAPCPGNPNTYIIIVNPEPVMSANPSHPSVCSGVPFNIQHSSTVTGSTYSWTVGASGAVSGHAAGSGDSIVQTVVNLTGVDQTVTYNIVPEFSGCPGDTVHAVVTVKFEPQITPVSDVTVCSAGPVGAISFASTPAGANFNWTNDNLQTGLAASGAGDILGFTANANNGNTQEVSTVIVIPDMNGCIGAADTFLITVHPEPTVTNAPLNEDICSGDSSSLVAFTGNVTGTSFAWTLISNNNLQPGTLNNGTDTLPAQALTSLTPAGGSLVYDVSPTANGCPGVPVVYTITVLPTPDVQLPADQTLCSGDSMQVVFFAGTVAGTTYSWTAANGGTISGFLAFGSDSIPDFTLVNMSTVTDSVIFTVIPTAAGCPGPSADYTVYVKPTPDVIMNPAVQDNCSAQTSLQVNISSNVAGTQFQWNSFSPVIISGATVSGSGDIPAETISNSGTVIDTVLYIITPDYLGCIGPDDTARIVVYPVPDVAAAPNPDTICSNQATQIVLSGNVTGTTYSWISSVNPGISGAGAGSGDTIIQVLQNPTSNIETVTYTVSPSANGCPGAPIDVDVTVRPLPLITPTLDMTLCPADTSSLVSFTANMPGTVFNWTQDNPLTGAPASGTGDFPVFIAGSNLTATDIIGTVIVTPSLNGCNGNRDTFNIIIRPQPDVSNNPMSQTVCDGMSSLIVGFSSNVIGTSFTWNLIGTTNLNPGALVSGNDTIPPQTLTTVTPANGTATYEVIPTANGCVGDTVQYIYTVTGSPDVILPPDQALCDGDTIATVVFSSSTGGVGYSWTATSASGSITGFTAVGIGNIPADTLHNPSLFADTITYLITPSIAGCFGPTVSYQITVQPVATVTAAPLIQTICDSSSTVQIGITSNTSGSSISWNSTSPADLTGFAASGSGDVPPQVVDHIGFATDSVSIVITPEIGGCPGINDTAWVVVYPTPDVMASPTPLTVCSNDSAVVVFTSNVANTSFSWVAVPNGNVTGISSGSGDSLIQVLGNFTTNPEVVSYIVTPTANGCTGIPDTVNITVHPIPMVNPTADTIICPDMNVAGIIFTSNLPGTIFNWTQSNPLTGAPTSGSGDIPPFIANSNLTAFNISGTVIVVPSLNGCVGIPDTFDIIIQPRPDITTTPLSQTICSGLPAAAVPFSGNLPGTSFGWNLVSTSNLNPGALVSGFDTIPSQTLTSSVMVNGSAVYEVIASANGCFGDTVQYVYNVTASPDVILPPDQAICSGDTITGVTISSSIPGTTFSWTATSATGSISGFTASGTSTIPADTLFNPSLLPDTITYVISPGASGCVGQGVIYQVTVQPVVTITTVPQAQTICDSTATVQIGITSGTPGANISWTSTAPADLTGFAASGNGDVPPQVVDHIGFATDSVSIVVTPSMGGCPGINDTAWVIVHPSPDVISSPNPLTVCSGDSAVVVFTSNMAGTSFSWVAVPNGNVTGISSGFGDSLIQVLGNFTMNPEIVSYIVTPTANGCVGIPDTVNITVRPVPTVNPTADTLLCPDQNVAGISFTSNLPGTVFSWTQSNPLIGAPTSGTGDIPAFIVGNNPSMFNLIGTVIVTPTLNGCIGISDTFDLIVRPKPDITTTPLVQTVCSGVPALQVPFSGSLPGTSFGWDLASTSALNPGALVNGVDTIPSQTFISSGLINGTAIYDVVPSANGCFGDTVQYVYNVIASPDVILPPDQAICSGDTITGVVIGSSVVGTTFNWTATSSTGSIIGFTASGNDTIPADTLFNPSLLPDTITYVITPNVAGCFGPSVTYQVIVQPVVTVTTAPLTQTICDSTATVQIGITSNTPGANISWTSTSPADLTGFAASGNGDVPPQVVDHIGFATDSVSIVITPSLGGCPGINDTAWVVVYPTPDVMSNPNPLTVCSNDSAIVVFTGNVAGTSFSWVAVPNVNVIGVSSGVGDSLIQVLGNFTTNPEIVSYVVTPSANGCVGIPDTIEITVQPVPTMNPVADLFLCPGQNAAGIGFTSNQPGTIYSWVQNNTAVGTAASGTDSIPAFIAGVNNTSASITGTIIVTPSFNGCNGLADTFDIVVYPTPDVTNNPLAQAVCSGLASTPVAFTSSVAGTSFSWELAGTSNLNPGALSNGTDTIPSQTFVTSTIINNGVATYYVVPSANGCLGDTVQYVYTISPNPDITLPADQVICNGDTITSVQPGSSFVGATYSWTASTTGSVTGFTASGNGPIPTDTLFNPTFVADTVIYVVTPFANACPGIPASYTVVVQPTATASVVPAIQTVCDSAATTQIVASSNVVGTQIQWTAVGSPNLSGYAANGTGDYLPQHIDNTGYTSDTVQIVFMPDVNGCPGINDTALIIVHPTPDVTALPNPDTICSGNTTNIVFSGNVQGTTYSWLVSNNTLVSGQSNGVGNSIQHTLSQTGVIDTSIVYTVVPAANGCLGASITVPVVIRPVPVITANPDIQVCSGLPVASINFSSTVAGTNFNWTNNNISIGLAAFGAGDSIPGFSAPVYYGPASDTAEVVVQYEYGGCFGTPDTFLIVLDPEPFFIITPNPDTICSGLATAFNLLPSIPGTQFSWTVNSGGLIGPAAGSGNSINQQLVNLTNNFLTAEYIITPSLNGCLGETDTAIAVVNPGPQTSITTGPTAFCNGNLAEVFIQSPVPGISFSWNVIGGNNIIGASAGAGDTISQMLYNPTNAPDSVSYEIYYTHNLCYAVTDTVTFLVYPTPVAVAIPDTSTICAGVTTSIVLNSTVANTTFSWTDVPSANAFGSAPGIGDTIAQTLTSNGLNQESVQYNIQYSANGCPGIPITAMVYINPVVTPVPSPDSLAICSGQGFTVGLTAPVGAIISWAHIPNPNIIGAYAGVGDTIAQTLTTSVQGGQIQYYEVLADYHGCVGPPDTVMVVVNALPALNLGVSQALCLNNPPLGLQPIPAGGTWSGTGIVSAQPGIFDPAVAGVGGHRIYYNYTDTVTGCANVDSINIVVNPLPIPSISHDTLVCVNTSLNFVNNSQGAAFHAWNFGNGATSTQVVPNYMYPATGLYTISYTATTPLGCSAGMISTVRVIDAPAAQFTPNPDLGCAPLNVNLNNQSTGYNNTYVWNLGNGTNSNQHTPPTMVYQGSMGLDTIYVVNLVATNQCGVSSYTDTVRVLSQPVAYFGTNLSVGCSPLTVQLSQNSYGAPTSYTWNFGDGNFSVNPTPGSHTFHYNGTNDTLYFISLTVSNQCGVDTHVDSVRVIPNTVQAFFNTNPINGCAPLAVNFTNFSNGATIYNWDFGDGNTSNLINPSHTYHTGGAYNVMLAANNGCGFDTAYFVLNVLPQPSVSFHVLQDSICQNNAVQFVNTSVNISNAYWDFGNGTTSNLANPSAVYNQSGTFNVMLIGSAQATGCTDTAYGTVFIKPGVDVEIALSDSIGCAPLTINFQDIGSGSIFHQWTYGDGQTGASASPTHTFLSSGFFNPTLVGSNQWGCTDTAVVNVWVNPVPTASFNVPPLNPCEYPAAFQITNTSTGAIGYQWNLGNGQTSVQFEPNVVYNIPDTYTIQLVASNQYGCTDTAVQDVIMNPTVMANFMVTPEVGCAPHKADLVNLSVGADSWTWYFGDGDSSFVENPIHIFQNPGSYTVSLIASNAAGCVDTLTIANAVLVNASPIAGFISTPAEQSYLTPMIELLDLSSGATSAFYDMGNGEINTLLNGQFIYTSPDTGTYIIMQIVTNEFGCTDTAYSTFRLYGETTIYVPTAFTPNNDGRNDLFRAYGTNVFDFELLIYNRWGELIFESNDITEAWNGTKFNAGGPVAKSDVYVWKITYRDIHKVRHRLRGRVTLLNNDTE